MKRILPILVVLALLFSSVGIAIAETEVSNMTYEELQTLQKDVSVAIRAVEPVDGSLIYDTDGVRVFYQGIVEDYTTGAKFQIENATDQDIGVSLDDVSVNDFMMNTLFSSTVMSGKKAIDTLDFLYLDDYGISEIENFEFTVHVFDAQTYMGISDSKPITINP